MTITFYSAFRIKRLRQVPFEHEWDPYAERDLAQFKTAVLEKAYGKFFQSVFERSSGTEEGWRCLIPPK